MIAAIGTRTRALGKGGDLLWHIPEDMKRFKALTMGHPVIMGRKTWESIPGKFRPLPGRTNIVITRTEGYEAPGASIAYDFASALKQAESENPSEIFVIGGSQIYMEGLPYARRLYLSLIDSDEEGDIFFPAYSEFTNETSREEHPESTPPYTFVVLEK